MSRFGRVSGKPVQRLRGRERRSAYRTTSNESPSDLITICEQCLLEWTGVLSHYHRVGISRPLQTRNDCGNKSLDEIFTDNSRLHVNWLATTKHPVFRSGDKPFI